MLSFRRLEAVRLEAYSSLETAPQKSMTWVTKVSGSGFNIQGLRAAGQVWVSPVRPRVIEAMLSFRRLEAVRLEAYSSLETARCFAALAHLPNLGHLDLRLSGSLYALQDNLDALASLARCSRLVRLHHHLNSPRNLPRRPHSKVACMQHPRPSSLSMVPLTLLSQDRPTWGGQRTTFQQKHPVSNTFKLPPGHRALVNL